ncbi:MAG: transcription termination/antitermination protein NusG [Anaerococcus sp.]|uniref:transcription termination/antitermination protein NusG n=1 Tax=Anaerococcus sp. TaxID=1872515 RepID=UPI002603C312|nr:transcription termination/antitermination protein NusG [Anaerococcus sp.]MCI5971736.1 transcription termination/antitermination protein NusG [Anaerococcus sp.]MDD6918538.1 transcription termination/antitermination protein NusG [Peptoniphilaceae bacterium]MDY2927191.1 transcription termination/antitermination protein NusG [Anaerococcus sp.]
MTDSYDFSENKEEENLSKDKEISTEESKDRDLEAIKENARWYVVHTYTGYENRVNDKIQMMIDNEQNPDILEVTVPTEEYVEVKNDTKKVKTRKLFPGYVMVKMNITNKSWYIIRNTQGVTGFVGPDGKPVALTPAEVRKFGVKDEAPILNINVNVGDDVNIISGPFEGFVAKVEEVDKEKGSIKAFVDMFGRDTLIDLDFTDIETI